MSRPKILICFIICFSGHIVFAQNSFKGIIVDAEDKTPIEFVGIYNTADHTITNEDGHFKFTSNLDSITFYRLGYQKTRTIFKQLKDTVFLKKSVIDLNEVVVTNAKTLWQKVGDSIKNNFVFEPYKEKFMLRGILKQNNNITRIQDIEGKLLRRTLLYTQNIKLDKKDYLVELTNMRKIGIVKDENNVYFKFPTIFGLFSNFIRSNATGDEFILTEYPFENEDKIKLEFILNPTIQTAKIKGYYIINTKNYALEEFYIKSEPQNQPYSKSKKFRYRTTFYEMKVLYKKDPVKNRYFMSWAKSNETVFITDENESFNENYKLQFIYTSFDNFKDFDVSKNTSSTKDIFKIKYPYNAEYWNTQNELLLTDEMKSFIQKANQEDNEFKVSTNIKN